MALAVAQTCGTNPVDNADTNAATFGSSTTSGGLIVVLVYGWRSVGSGGLDLTAAGAVTDNKGNTYTAIVTNTNIDFGCSIHYAKNITGGASHQVTIDPAGTGNYFSWLALEVTGADITSPLDVTASASGAVTSTPATGNLSGTTAQNDEIEIAVLVEAAASATITVDTVSPTYNEDSENTDGINHVPGEIDHRILTATTNVGASWTLGSTTNRWAAAAATFKQATGGAATSLPPVYSPSRSVRAGIRR